MLPIRVIGSLNIDLTIRLPRFHAPGETITGESFRRYPGGKGGNQAVAAARLDADVHFVGMVGDDDNGAYYLSVLQKEGVNTDAVGVAEDVSTGIALIEVDAKGENRIAIVPGANAMVDDQWVIDHLKQGGRCLTMLQLEIPLYTCTEAARRARERGDIVMLDPAPALPLKDSFLQHIDYITPNEGELARLTGMGIRTLADAEEAARSLLKRGVKAVVAKLGANGCLYVDNEKALHMPGFKVNVKDTTAAGDSFNAGLAYAFSHDYPLEEALRFANAVGACSTTGEGAQGAMPTMKQVERLIKEQG